MKEKMSSTETNNKKNEIKILRLMRKEEIIREDAILDDMTDELKQKLLVQLVEKNSKRPLSLMKHIENKNRPAKPKIKIEGSFIRIENLEDYEDGEFIVHIYDLENKGESFYKSISIKDEELMFLPRIERKYVLRIENKDSKTMSEASEPF